MGTSQNFLANPEFIQHRPIDGIDKIAAQFVARKPGAVEQRDLIAQPSERNRSRATRRPGADNRHVECIHRRSPSRTTAAMRKGNTENSSTEPMSAWRNRSRHSGRVKARRTDSGASVSVMTLRV